MNQNTEERQIITKVVVKDYVSKKCPYITSMELVDRGLIDLLKKSEANQEEYQELVEIEKESSDGGVETDEEEEKFFDIRSVLRDYPHLKQKLAKFDKNIKRNRAEEIIEKYNDDQLISKLSRRLFELKEGPDKCIRCDTDRDGKTVYNMDLLTKYTEDYLKEPGKKYFFEGQIEWEDMRARFDVLEKNDDGTYNIYEVKGTNTVFASKGDNPDIDTRIKKKYLYDLLFQYHIYQKKFQGKIKDVFYIYTNRDFRLRTLSYPIADEDLEDLFIVKGVINLESGTVSLREYFDSDGYVEDGRSKTESLDDILSEIREIKKLSKVSPKKNYLCRKGPICPFIDMCFPDNKDNMNSIFKLTNWGSYGGNWRNMNKAINDRVYEISNLDPNRYDYTEFRKSGYRSNAYTQIQYEKGKFTHNYVIDWNQMEDILKKDYLKEGIDYLLFFDFESFQHPIPLVKHLGCWKQVVSQYSLHVCERGYDLSKHDFDKGIGGGVRHFEYIADPETMGYDNPSIELYETLRKQLIECGIDPMGDNYRVVVFNDTFEKGRMKEFVRDFPTIADFDLVQFVAHFRENVVDLLHFFTYGAIYGRDFVGRGSLKVVQPTLRDDKDVQTFYNKFLPFDFYNSLDYHKGDKCLVYNGGICLDLYKSLIIRCHLGEQNKGTPTKELLDEARAYCKIDTWGTVIIYDVIKNVYEGKLQLDVELIK